MGLLGLDKSLDILQSSPILAELKTRSFEQLSQTGALPPGVGLAFGLTDRSMDSRFAM